MDRFKGILYGSPVFIALIYLITGGLWILFSDQIVVQMAGSVEEMTRLQTYKGWAYVFLSALFLFFLVRYNNIYLGNVISRLNKTGREYSTLFEQSAFGIVYVNPDGTWQRVNERLCQILGYNKSELAEMNQDILIHPDDKEMAKQMDRQLLNGDRHYYKVEGRFRQKSGDYVDMQLTKSIVLDDTGAPLYLVVIFEELTNQREVERELKNSLKEKEVLLSELHHRVKNNLALISALLELQSHHLDDEAVNNILQGSRLRIKSLSMIYETFIGSDHSAIIEFGSYLEQLAGFVSRLSLSTDRGISLEIDVQRTYLNINQAVPCGLLCNELLMNAFSHAFEANPVNPVVCVGLEEKNGFVQITIRDNGSGLSAGIDLDRPETFGFTVVKSLVSQLKGTIKLKSENGAGFVLTFRKADRSGPSSTFSSQNSTSGQYLPGYYPPG